MLPDPSLFTAGPDRLELFLVEDAGATLLRLT
jgi:hypothetical protein